MAYLDARSTRPSPAAIAGVVGIHAAIGYALVTGLAAEFVEVIKTGPMPTTEYKDPPPPPPPPEQKTETPEPSAAPPVHAPAPELKLAPRPPVIETTPAQLPPIDDIIPKPLPPSDFVNPAPKPTPGLKPVAAAPRNNIANWVTTNDYPGRAIREEWEGTTGFRVTVGTDGKVESCTITRSSGHAALDEATCKNVERRARFNPAKDGFGEKTIGSYSSSVRWQLPN